MVHHARSDIDADELPPADTDGFAYRYYRGSGWPRFDLPCADRRFIVCPKGRGWGLSRANGIDVGLPIIIKFRVF